MCCSPEIVQDQPRHRTLPVRPEEVVVRSNPCQFGRTQPFTKSRFGFFELLSECLDARKSRINKLTKHGKKVTRVQTVWAEGVDFCLDCSRFSSSLLFISGENCRFGIQFDGFGRPCLSKSRNPRGRVTICDSFSSYHTQKSLDLVRLGQF